LARRFSEIFLADRRDAISDLGSPPILPGSPWRPRHPSEPPPGRSKAARSGTLCGNSRHPSSCGNGRR